MCVQLVHDSWRRPQGATHLIQASALGECEQDASPGTALDTLEARVDDALHAQADPCRRARSGRWMPQMRSDATMEGTRSRAGPMCTSFGARQHRLASSPSHPRAISIDSGSWAGGSHAAIQLERLCQPPERLRSVRLTVKNKVLHPQCRIALHCRSKLRHCPSQDLVEDTRSLGL